MKPFNLEEALAGKLCVTRNGNKAVILADRSKYFPANHYQLLGYIQHKDPDIWYDKEHIWTNSGKYMLENIEDGNDIIGMYEEPQPLVDVGKLPAPLKDLSHGDTFYRVNGTGTISKEIFNFKYAFHIQVLNNGFCFKTEADAQAWLDAMKGARR